MNFLSTIFGRRKVPPNNDRFELIGHLGASISHSQTKGIVITFKDNRMGKAYPAGTGVYLYRNNF